MEYLYLMAFVWLLVMIVCDHLIIIGKLNPKHQWQNTNTLLHLQLSFLFQIRVIAAFIWINVECAKCPMTTCGIMLSVIDSWFCCETSKWVEFNYKNFLLNHSSRPNTTKIKRARFTWYFLQTTIQISPVLFLLY